MSEPVSETEKLLNYMTGFRRGVTGSACTETQMNNPDFKTGHDAGRETARMAYAEACKRYNARLSSLRSSNP